MAAKTSLIAVLTISVFCVVSAFAAPPRYEIIDLGTLGGDQSAAQSINDEGQIVGRAKKISGSEHATLFDPTGSGYNLDLGTLGYVPTPGPGPFPFQQPYSGARSNNNNGQIVGWAKTSSGKGRAAIFDATGNGNNINLGTLSHHSSSGAAAINDNGQIVGACSYMSPWPEEHSHATLFDPTGSGNHINLGTLGGDESAARFINDLGQIVGVAENSSGERHATLFDPTGNGNNIDLAPLDIASEVYSINDSGHIVGEIYKSGYWHATLFDANGNGHNIDLGTLGGNESSALSINERGQIVGSSQKGVGKFDGYATLFDPTGAGNNIDLNTLIDPDCDLTLTAALSINNNGWIVGVGFYFYDRYPFFDGPYAYLLIPEPSNTDPVACIVGGDRTVEAQGHWGAAVILDGSCSADADSTPGTNDDINDFNWYQVDPYDPNFAEFLASGQTIDCNLFLGEHLIILEVIDKAGASDTNEVTIIVQDTIPPTINNVSATPDVLWPPNHNMVEVQVTVDTEDLCDPAVICRIVDVNSNEPVNGPADGNTGPNWQITGDLTVNLRAERAAIGTRRVYIVHIECTDASGNTAAAAVEVTVPHDQGKAKK